jgi:hypothetical protein
MAYHG